MPGQNKRKTRIFFQSCMGLHPLENPGRGPDNWLAEKDLKQIRLKRILSFAVFADGLQVKKDAGSHALLKIEYPSEEASLILNRLLRY